MNKQKQDFAEGINLYKIFIFFILGSIFGSFFEEILFFFQNGSWTRRHDLIYGPFSTLYGFGVVLFLCVFVKKNVTRSIPKTFFYISLLGGLVEYIAGLLSETFLHIKFWDYSNMFLNINGRTTIPIMLIWGLMGTILLKVVYPFISKWIEKIPKKIGKPVCILLFILLALDMLVSYTAFFRMLSRSKGINAKNKIEELYDKLYPDEFMYQKFPILQGKLN